MAQRPGTQKFGFLVSVSPKSDPKARGAGAGGGGVGAGMGQIGPRAAPGPGPGPRASGPGLGPGSPDQTWPESDVFLRKDKKF